jgi:protein-tyrosine phosphatase
VDHFTLVFVCSGNRFRSPLAEAFVRRLTTGLPVEASSYGTLPLGAAPPLREALKLAPWFGVDLSSHRAREVGAASLGQTDLLLGFEQEHVRRAVVDADAPRDRSFTLPEFVELLEEIGDVPDGDTRSARRLVGRAASQRAGTQSLVAGSVADPFGKSWSVYRETATEIRELSVRLVERLFGVSGASGLPALPPKLGRGLFRPRR